MAPRAALVTGAGRRIGRDLALALAADGFDVAVHCGTSVAAAGEVARLIEGLGRRAVVLPADLEADAAMERLVPDAVAALGPLELLVNSAGLFEFDRLATVTRARFDRQIAVNVWAPLALSQGFVAQLPDGGSGQIVNLIDARVLNWTPNYTSYSVSKAGLWSLTEVLARELAPRVRVNAIAPGWVVLEDETAEDAAVAAARMPLGRGTTPGEIVAALRYLLAAPAVTGQILALDGGQHMGWLPPGAIARDR